MHKLIIKIITCSIILIYVGGLANYQIIGFLHYTHHFIEHTLGQHHDHSHNTLSNHGHSHNSFVDYSLYIEEVNNENETKNEAVPVSVKTDYQSHLTSNTNYSDHLVCCSEMQFQKLSSFLIYRFAKPPFPPPRTINYI